MSSQNSRAENFSRITTEPPRISTAPVASTPPAVWYIGRQSYMRSLALRVHDAGEGVARQHQPVVVDVRGLRQAGGAGREDVERAVLDGERAALRVGEFVARQLIDRVVDARHAPRQHRRAARPWRRRRRARACCPARPAVRPPTTMCCGLTALMQWASAAPVRLVLSSATTPPARVTPSQIARNSGRFGISRQMVSPLRMPCASAQRA